MSEPKKQDLPAGRAVALRYGDNAALARQSIKGNALNNIGFFNGRMKSELHKKQSIERWKSS